MYRMWKSCVHYYLKFSFIMLLGKEIWYILQCMQLQHSEVQYSTVYYMEQKYNIYYIAINGSAVQYSTDIEIIIFINCKAILIMYIRLHCTYIYDAIISCSSRMKAVFCIHPFLWFYFLHMTMAIWLGGQWQAMYQ